MHATVHSGKIRGYLKLSFYLCSMLLYNVTVIVEDDAEQAWFEWMQETHIPEVMSTGKFVSNRLLKLLDSPNEGATCVFSTS